MKHMCRDALGGQQVCRLKSPDSLHARAHDRDIATFAHDVGFADLEVVFGSEDRRVGVARQAQVYRSFPVVGRQHGLTCLHTVGGCQHRHMGHGAHDGDVGDLLVGFSGLAREDPRIRRADLDVEPGLRDNDTQLVEIAIDEEHSEARQPGDQAAGGHTGGDTHHVLLGDTHLQKVIGPLPGDDVGLRRICQVAVEDISPRVLVDELNEGTAEDIALGDKLGGDAEIGHQSAASCAASSARATRRLSSVTGRECQL